MKTVLWLFPILLIVAVASSGCGTHTDNPAQAGDATPPGASALPPCCGGGVAPAKPTCGECGNEKGSPECSGCKQAAPEEQ